MDLSMLISSLEQKYTGWSICFS